MRIGRKKYVLWLLPIVILSVSAAFVLLFPAFRISSIKVAGVNRLGEREVLEMLPFGEGDHILFIRAGLTRETITADERVAWAEIHRKFPGEVNVLVMEEHPALLLSAGRIWGLTEEGKLLPIENPYEIPNLPILSGIGPETILVPFKTPESDNLMQGLKFWSLIKTFSPQFLDRISEIHIDGDGEFQIVLTGDGLVVEFGKGDCGTRACRLAAILDDLDIERSGVEFIDLRYSDQAVVCLAENTR